MIIRVLAQAEAELVEAVDWYECRFAGLGERLLADVERGLALIAERPLAWRSMDDDIRQLRLASFPYGIVYRVTECGVLVLAFAHLHRRPEYWRDRL